MERGIGLIYPPFELRSTIDKTASFVAKNGVEFESRILNEPGSEKFAFINKENPFNAYYRKRIDDFRNGISLQDSGPSIPNAIVDINNKKTRQNDSEKEVLMLTSIESAFGFLGGSAIDIEEPRKEQYTVSHPFLSKKDEAIIKITAMYLARNGKEFLSELTNREANNPQFDFLNPGHALFNYFADLVESYSFCLIPNKEYIKEVKRDTEDLQNILRRGYKSNIWNSKQKEGSLLAIENNYIDLNWITVNIIETVEFNEDESLPEPVNFSNLSTVVLEVPLDNLNDEDRKELLEYNDLSKDQLEALIVEEEKDNKSTGQENAFKEDIDNFMDEELKNIKIIKNYVRRPKKRGYCTDEPISNAIKKMFKCPITGQLIPSTDISNHMKVLLLDPKWKQQKHQLLKKAQQETAFTPSTNIEENLAAFVSRRPDLFGTIEEVVTSNIKGESKNKDDLDSNKNINKKPRVD
ncbi:Pre-mRNA splicing factor SF3a 2xSWAP domain protein [Cryptosporidium ryanae]|uniref:Pre-mRNA splicing factor SF3a 2xSWAP domain protein n=1 Tax=Cryptosporidium ryanae TaxID=515981 RepID=UPI003519FB1A|nr:Pre-mRNA splicing factor SF3a 2xSWAP domain protein [Cryptosporidium ryanae]